MALGFSVTAVCSSCKLFLPVMDCPVCDTSHCERHVVTHAAEHRRDLDHARLAAGGNKGLLKTLRLA